MTTNPFSVKLRNFSLGMAGRDPAKYIAGITVAEALEVANEIDRLQSEIERLQGCSRAVQELNATAQEVEQLANKVREISDRIARQRKAIGKARTITKPSTRFVKQHPRSDFNTL